MFFHLHHNVDQALWLQLIKKKEAHLIYGYLTHLQEIMAKWQRERQTARLKNSFARPSKANYSN